MQEQTPKQRCLKRNESLRTERATWDPHWRELADAILPRASRFVTSDANHGSKKNAHIINGTPTWAARTLDSGMMAGITPPSRPWFRYTLPDPELAEFGAVKDYLYICEERTRLALQKSNIYNALHQIYRGLGTFGTAVMHVEEDFKSVLRAYTFPIGSFCLANSARLQVDTVYRELRMTVSQLVSQFGEEKCSPRVKEAYRQGNYETWIDVLHVVEPNRNHEPGRIGPPGMPFSSWWFEKDGDPDLVLREAGFAEFPCMAPRWNVTGEDVYGESPGMEALGDARALQLLEQRKLQGIDKIINPPMRGPSSLANTRASLLPGDVTYVDAMAPGQTFEPAMIIDPRSITVMAEEIREHAGRVKTSFFADLFLALSQSEGTMTAREVAERHEEKMLQLGPVMERLDDELLDPLLTRVFDVLNRNGFLPEPPQELQGHEIRVEYISIMAQAQKLLGTSAIERLSSFVGNLAAAKPEVLDNVDFDRTTQEYAGMLGVPPAIIRSEEDVKAIRDQRAQQQQAAQQDQAAASAVQGAQVLSQTDTGGDNALTRMLGNMGAGPGTTH